MAANAQFGQILLEPSLLDIPGILDIPTMYLSLEIDH